MSRSPRQWKLRTVLPELAQRYRDEGLWADRTLGQWVEASIERNRDNTFRVFSDVRAYEGTFGDLDNKARGFASWMRAQDIGDGDVVMMQLPNWAEAAVTFWAAAYVGAVIVPVVHFYGGKEVEYILRVLSPDVVVTPERFRNMDFLATYQGLLEAHPETRWLVVGDTPSTELPDRATSFAAVLEADPITEITVVDPNEPAVIAFTSGTTSNPKGVIHTHQTLAAEILQSGTTVINEPKSGPPTGPFALTGAPIGHYGGMLNAFLRPLMVNTKVHLLDQWDPAVVLKLMLEHDLIVNGGATFFLTSVLDHPDFTAEHLKRIPAVGLGGSPVPVAVTERARDLGIMVFRAYGSTEHPSSTGCAFTEPEEKRLRTDGKPLRGVDLRLDDEGQISTRGAELFMGYTDPDLTASVFDDEGWYRSGDVGVLDADGFLSITDRVSDVIIRAGENVSAQEVEEVFLTIDGVAEVAVVAAPDDRLGEQVAAVFTMRGNAAPPTLEDVRTHVGERGLSRQKWPEALYQVHEFPRTASGKIQKFRLRQQLRDGAVEQLVE